MPAMLRWNKKADKIAYDILGVPQNLRDKSTKRKNKTRKKLQSMATRYVRGV
jgi:hypothetical protein